MTVMTVKNSLPLLMISASPNLMNEAKVFTKLYFRNAFATAMRERQTLESLTALEYTTC